MPVVCGIASTTLFVYVVMSVSIAGVRDLHISFCDSTEQDCSLPWTTARVATWVLWGAAGLALLAATLVSYRSEARRTAVVGLVLAVMFGVAAVLLFRSL
jgi:hypothetical protein